MRAPLLLPWSIGVDVCHIRRIFSIISRRGDVKRAFLRRLLNDEEMLLRKSWEEEITATVAKGSKPDYTDTPLSAAEIAGPGWKSRQFEPERFGKHVGSIGGLELKVRDLMSPGYIGRPNRNTWLMATSMAGVWAAKEATIKAHTGRRLTMHDITITRGAVINGLRQAPQCFVKAPPIPNEIRECILRSEVEKSYDEKALGRAQFHSPGTEGAKNELEQNTREVKISISHDGEYATAIAMVPEEIVYNDLDTMVKKIVRNEIREKELRQSMEAIADVAKVELDAGAILEKLGGERRDVTGKDTGNRLERYGTQRRSGRRIISAVFDQPRRTLPRLR